MRSAGMTAILACAIALLCGCSSPDTPMNPSMAITVADGRAELTRMREAPLPPVRPVVVIGGLFDVGLG